MNFDKKNYKKFADAHAKKSPIVRDCLRAFFVGGGICVLGQSFIILFGLMGIGREDAGLFSSSLLILASACLTCFGYFEKIAKFAGTGTLVPITGFANAVVSPAIDAKAEGFILGVGSKIFTVAGPVLLYGTLAGTLYGLFYWLFTLIF